MLVLCLELVPISGYVYSHSYRLGKADPYVVVLWKRGHAVSGTGGTDGIGDVDSDDLFEEIYRTRCACVCVVLCLSISHSVCVCVCV